MRGRGYEVAALNLTGTELFLMRTSWQELNGSKGQQNEKDSNGSRS
jgi:hypothetical protein